MPSALDQNVAIATNIDKNQTKIDKYFYLELDKCSVDFEAGVKEIQTLNLYLSNNHSIQSLKQLLYQLLLE